MAEKRIPTGIREDLVGQNGAAEATIEQMEKKAQAAQESHESHRWESKRLRSPSLRSIVCFLDGLSDGELFRGGPEVGDHIRA